MEAEKTKFFLRMDLRADELLDLVPEERAREILSGDAEGVRPYLVGTPLESFLVPGNERLFERVIGGAYAAFFTRQRERGEG